MEKTTDIRLLYFVPVEPLFRFFSGLFFFSSLALLVSSLYPWPQSFSSDFFQTLGVEVLMLLFFGFLFYKPSGLSLTAEGFCYAKNFLWKQTVTWQSIQKVQTGVGENRTYYIDVFHEGNQTPNPLPLFAKPYTEKGMSIFVEMLEAKAPQAELDERTRKMKKGVFPSVFFGDTQKAKKDAPLLFSYLLVGAILLFLPSSFTISDPRARFGFPAALLLFGLLAFWVDQFDWENIRRHMGMTFYHTASGGSMLILINVVKNLVSSNFVSWNNVLALFAGYALYFMLAFVITGRHKSA